MPSVATKESQGRLYKPILKKFKAITKCAEDFLSIQQLKSTELRILLKDVYDLAVSRDSINKGNSEILPELVVDDLDEEQIWQLIELRNNVVWPQLLENTSKLLSLQELKLQVNFADGELSENGNGYNDSEEDSDSNDSMEEEDSKLYEDDDDEEDDDELEKEYKSNKVSKSRGKPSIVDDKFFKLSDMEAFLVAEDEKELKKQSGKHVDDFSINYFDENMDDDESENIEYKDFFDDDPIETDSASEKQARKMEHSEEDDDKSQGSNDNVDEEEEEEDDDEDEQVNNKSDANIDEDENDNGSHSEGSENTTANRNKIDAPKSSFEERQERLNQRIQDYEEEILGEKPWQLKGEIQATSRPQNSLLEEILEFEATTRPAPIVTEETTLRLEDIIRQRIKDNAWDDVELKVKPLNTPQEYRKQLVLDQEKSKESLAQIYEKQYQKEVEKLDTNASDAKEEEPKSHKEIKEMMQNLFVKLDALSNFHFTPKPVAPEPKIITNIAAVNIEEVAPVAVSDAKLLAPEEIRKRSKGDTLGSNERNKTDKNRDRRHKKQKQRAVHKALEERDIQKQKMGIQLSKKEEQAKFTKSLTKHRNVEKVSASSDAGPMKSSKAFFSKLQETSSLKNKNLQKQKKPDAKALSAKKLKL